MDEWKISCPKFEMDRLYPRYAILPWSGHRRFAYDLVCFIRPECFIELGAYYGTSFFAFSQAVKDLGLDTECIAVDTWKGDAHTAPYETESFDTFIRVKDMLFPGIRIRVLKMSFAEALPSVENDSADIIHIDGCHEYESVKEDYESWLPKLRKNGVFLIHDVADDVNYGSVKFWREISSKIPHITFQHSWGLGVLFPKGYFYHDLMKKNNFMDKQKIYEYRSELDYAMNHRRVLEKMIDDRHQLIIDQQSLMLEKDETIEQEKKNIQEKNQLIDEQRRRIDALSLDLESSKKLRAQIESSFLLRSVHALQRRLGTHYK